MAFSILNGLGHILGWMKYSSVVPPTYKMYSTWRLNMLVSPATITGVRYGEEGGRNTH